MDEAVTYFGKYVESELDKIGHKPAKGEARNVAARKAKLEALLQLESKKKTGFADPAALFGK